MLTLKQLDFPPPEEQHSKSQFCAVYTVGQVACRRSHHIFSKHIFLVRVQISVLGHSSSSCSCHWRQPELNGIFHHVSRLRVFHSIFLAIENNWYLGTSRLYHMSPSRRGSSKTLLWLKLQSKKVMSFHLKHNILQESRFF